MTGPFSTPPWRRSRRPGRPGGFSQAERPGAPPAGPG
jgi:hypothetical protein